MAEALQTIDDTIALVYRNGDLFAIPELLRIKGEILVELHPADLSSAEQCFARSLELARQQGALAWELRTATSLSRAWLKRDRREEARDLLDSVYDRLTEGLECADARAAKDILQHLARTTSYAEKSV